MQNECFGTRLFWQWFFYGTAQGLLILSICFFGQKDLRTDGQTVGFWVSGTLVYAAVVVVVNQKLLMATHNIDWGASILIGLSILVFFLAVLAESFILFLDDIYGVFVEMMIDSDTYFVLFFTVTTTYLFEKLIFHASEYLDERKGKQKIIQEVEPLPPYEDHTVEENLHEEENFHGYAFSQENNPNPELANRVRQTTLKRLSRKDIEM